MKILKSFLIATIAVLTLNSGVSTASALNELEINDSENPVVMTLEITQLDFVRDIELIQSTFDAPVIIEIVDDEGVVEVEIDGTEARIHADGINARIHADGINARIRADGINARIHTDGIIPRVVTVRQLGVVIFSEIL